jgi:DNA-binding NarL/FixJ family response regulator
VADDNPAFLRKLTSLLLPSFEIVATATDGRTALDLIRYHKPEVAVLDLAMPVLSGLDVLRELAKDVQSPTVVICSGEIDPAAWKALRQAGALAYVFKGHIEKDLIPALESAIQGKPFVSFWAAVHERLG